MVFYDSVRLEYMILCYQDFFLFCDYGFSLKNILMQDMHCKFKFINADLFWTNLNMHLHIA